MRVEADDGGKDTVDNNHPVDAAYSAGVQAYIVFDRRQRQRQK